MKLNKRQFMRSFRTPPPTDVETDGEYNIHLPTPRTSQAFELFNIYGNIDPHTDTPSIEAPLTVKHVGMKNATNGRFEIKLRIHGANALGFDEFSSLSKKNAPDCVAASTDSSITISPVGNMGAQLFGRAHMKFSKNTQYTLLFRANATPIGEKVDTPLAFHYTDGSIEPIVSSDIYDSSSVRVCATSASGKTLAGLSVYTDAPAGIEILADGFGIFEGHRSFADPYEAYSGTTYSYSTYEPIARYTRNDGSERVTYMDLVNDKLYSELELVDWTVDSPTIKTFQYNGTCTVVTCLSSRNLCGTTGFDARSNIFKKKPSSAEIKEEPYCISFTSMPYYYISLPGEFTSSAEIKAHLVAIKAEYYITYLTTRTGTYGFKRPTLSGEYTTIEVVSGELSPSKTVIRLK